VSLEKLFVPKAFGTHKFNRSYATGGGLSPKAVKKCFDTIKNIRQKFNTTILIVEQKVKEVLEIAARVYIMRLGKVVLEDMPANLTKERIKEAFIG
jgi:branched-chain amino acid transport system ATP-binding protein